MELRRYIESFTQYEQPKPPIDERIEIGRKELFDFSYSFFDDAYKQVFETNFIRHFYFREIGFDVMQRFKFELENYMRLNMGYWNKLFESELLEYDVLNNYKLTEEYKRNVDKNQDTDNKRTSTNEIDVDSTLTSNGSSTGSSIVDSKDNTTASGTSSTDSTTNNTGNQSVNTTSENDEVYSDTPQGKLSGLDYATNATFTKNGSDKTTDSTSQSTTNDETTSTQSSENIGNQTSESQQTSTNNDIASSLQSETGSDSLIGSQKTITMEDYILTKVGKVGERNYPKMVEEYRNTLLRIELQIFKEMNKQLFMLIYNF